MNGYLFQGPVVGVVIERHIASLNVRLQSYCIEGSRLDTRSSEDNITRISHAGQLYGPSKSNIAGRVKIFGILGM